MDERVLLTETRGAVRLLTLYRPAKLNALNANLVHALTDALHAAQNDAGDSGGRWSGVLRRRRHLGAAPADCRDPAGLLKHGDANIALTKLLARVDKPIIAAVHGYALGAGCGLALGSDLTVAGERAVRLSGTEGGAGGNHSYHSGGTT